MHKAPAKAGKRAKRDNRVSLSVRLPKSLLDALAAALPVLETDRNSYIVDALENLDAPSFLWEYGSRRSVMIRIPKPLHDRLVHLASEAKCSINQIVTYIVSQSLGD
mgnify:FL=1